MNFEAIAINRMIVGLVSIVFGVLFSRNRNVFKYGFWFSISLCFIGFWYILDFLQIYTRNYEHESIANIQVFIFIITEVLTYSLMMFNFYFCNKEKSVFFQISKFLLLVPIVVTILVFFNGSSLFLQTNSISSKLIKNPLLGYYLGKNKFYYVHIVYCIYTLIISLVLTVSSFFKETRISKNVYIAIFFSIILICVPTFNRVVVSNFISKSLSDATEHISTFCVLLAVSISFFVLSYDSSIVCLDRGKKNLFYNCGFAVLIFDNHEKFLDANDFGFDFLKKYDFKIENKFLFSQIKENKMLQKVSLPGQSSNENSFFLYAVNENLNYLVKKVPVENTLKFQTGFLLLIENVESYFTTMSNYEYSSIYDEETDCIKGKYFENKIQNYISKEEPIIIVMCSIQNITEINEQFGYKTANEVLTKFSEIIKNCSQIAEIFKLSYSSFGFILDSSTQSSIKSLFNAIRRECEQFFTEKEIPIKSRLGYTVTDSSKKSAQEFIDDSISNMMLDKTFFNLV